MTRCVGPGVKILAVVKANSYGHGAVGVARALEQEGCDFFGVASVEEAMELRSAGIKASIIVLAGIFPPDHGCVVENDLTPLVWSKSQIEGLERAAAASGKVVPVHLKVDTGMGRLGADEAGLKELAIRVKQSAALRLEGVMSHLSNADGVDHEVTRRQVARFRQKIGRAHV